MLWTRGLTSPERKLVVAARRGQRVDFNGTEVVRADVIRSLLLGRHGTVDPRGVQLTGARIEGALDLEGVHSTAGLNLTGCRLTHPVIARDAQFPWFELEGCHVPGLLADRLAIEGSLFLRNGFTAISTLVRAVRLPGARVGGNVELDAATLVSRTGPAFYAEDIHIGGNLFLRHKFCATADSSMGAVVLSGAFVGGNVNLLNSRLDNSGGPALRASGLTVKGRLQLGGGSVAEGRSRRVVIDLTGAHLGGLEWHRFEMCNSEKGGGVVGLEHVSAGWVKVASNVLCDAEPDQDCSTGDLLIDGLTYKSLSNSGSNWRSWLHWIHSHTREYTAQSYWQLAGVERAAGNDVAVRSILIAQQEDRRVRGEFRSPWSRLRHRLWGVLAGYGYRVGRTVVATLMVLVLAGALGLWAGHTPIRDGRYAAAHTNRSEQPFTPCSTFEQIGLGIDRGLPLAVTGVRERCDLDTISRRGQAFAMSIWFLQVAVWILATLVVVGYSGLIRRTD